jgi:hypothetical protein
MPLAIASLAEVDDEVAVEWCPGDGNGGTAMVAVASSGGRVDDSGDQGQMWRMGCDDCMPSSPAGD